MFGDTLGVAWDGFVMIFGNVPKKVEHFEIPELSGSIFPVAGCSKQSLLAYSGVKKKKNRTDF